MSDVASFADLSPNAVKRLRLRDGSKITVCSACKRACCWAGIFFCEDSTGASTIDITIKKARELALEHPDYWVELRYAEGFDVPRRRNSANG